MGSNITANPILMMFGSLVLIVKKPYRKNIVGTSGYDDDDDNDDDDDRFLPWYTPLPLLKKLKTTSTKKHKNCPTTSLLPSSSVIFVYVFGLALTIENLLETMDDWIFFPHPPIPNLPKTHRASQPPKSPTGVRPFSAWRKFPGFFVLRKSRYNFCHLFIYRNPTMKNSMFFYIPFFLSKICRDFEIFEIFAFQ